MKELNFFNNNGSKRERRWVIWFAVGVMITTSLPYLLGYSNQDQYWRFSGFLFNVEDGNSYIAKMLRGSTGEWLFRTPYTAIPQPGILLFLPYLLLGKLASPPALHEQLVALYHLFRIGAGIIMILATYEFLAVFIEGISPRQLATILATLGGGLGWILVISGNPEWMGSLPLEYYSPETFGFLSFYGTPHLALARGMLLGGFTIFLKHSGATFSRKSLLKRAAICGILFLIGGLAQPLIVPIAYAVFLMYFVLSGIWVFTRREQLSVIERSEWKGQVLFAGIASAFPLPYLVYLLFVVKNDHFVQLWSSQNIILSPHPYHYLLAFAVILPLSMVGNFIMVKENPWKGRFLAAWLLLFPVLAYAPVNLQRRLPDGIWVVLVASSVYGLMSIGIQPLWKRVLSLLITFLALPSTVFLLVGGINAALAHRVPVYRPADEIAAFSYLAGNAHLGDVVLGSYNTGNALPSWAPVTVLAGHGPESADLTRHLEEIRHFYNLDVCSRPCMELLKENQVRFVFWGPEEHQLGQGNPGMLNILKTGFTKGEYQVFEFGDFR